MDSAKLLQPPNRLKYLEGLRGIASLYVTLYHFLGWEQPSGLPVFLKYATSWSHFGHFAVNVFIVLSGYCLMLPVTQSAEHKLKGGFKGYFQRRAKRILPPYYAALILSLLMLLLSSEGFKFLTGTANSNFLLNFELGNLVSHIFLVHNLNPQWNTSINNPMWSVSTEWEIYFLFPTLLLPIWKFFGNLAVFITGLLVGITPHYLFPQQYNLDWACPWYLALFALGMIGASLTSSKEFQNSKWSKYILFVASISMSLYLSSKFVQPQDGSWLKDVLAGVFILCIILYCHLMYVKKQAERQFTLLLILESNLIIKISRLSYSLYLTHWIILEKSFEIASILNLKPTEQIILRGFIGIPIALLFSYLFYLVFERPYVTSLSEKKPI